MNQKGEIGKPSNKLCAARQVNARRPDFTCASTAGHMVHVDPRTGTRWGDGKYPRGWNRRWCKSYANPKLRRQSAIAAAASRGRR